MKITNIKIFENKNDSKLKAFASIELDNEFVVTGLRVVDGKNGLFVSMPQSKDKEENWYDIAFPVTKEGRSQIQDKVLKEYETTQKQIRGF